MPSLWHLSAKVWFLALPHIISLCLSVLICKKQLTIVQSSQNCYRVDEILHVKLTQSAWHVVSAPHMWALLLLLLFLLIIMWFIDWHIRGQCFKAYGYVSLLKNAVAPGVLGPQLRGPIWWILSVVGIQRNQVGSWVNRGMMSWEKGR